jgi:putative phosphoesterase
VTAVRGNVDQDTWARAISQSEVLEVGGVSIYVLHRREDLDLDPKAAGFSVVVCGHSHVPKSEVLRGVLYFNPGSAGPPRFRLPICVGRLTLRGNKVGAEIITLRVKER